MYIYLRLKELRERNKLTKKDFSSKIGINDSQYGKIEAGKIQPTISQIIDISSIFGVTTDWLLTGENPAETTDRMGEFDFRVVEEINSLKYAKSMQEKIISAQEKTIKLLEDALKAKDNPKAAATSPRMVAKQLENP